tara:strand:+ start:163 stop:618 length:456 start_codon:yes stop_codon:yes gene_type:complete
MLKLKLKTTVCILFALCVATATADEFLGGIVVGILNNNLYNMFDKIEANNIADYEKNHGICLNTKTTPFVKEMIYQQCYDETQTNIKHHYTDTEKQPEFAGRFIGLLTVIIIASFSKDDERNPNHNHGADFISGIIIGTTYDMIMSSINND